LITRLIGQHQGKNILSIQILGKEDLTVDDAETTQEKWRQYIDSYTLVSSPFTHQFVTGVLTRKTHPTEGLTSRIEPPFLKR
jgi:paired amphipathic helix protein Sin3a